MSLIYMAYMIHSFLILTVQHEKDLDDAVRHMYRQDESPNHRKLFNTLKRGFT